VNAAVQATVAEFGRLDFVIDNAGVMYTGGINGGNTDEWSRMVRTNLLGSMLVARATLPHLLEARGTLIQVSSTAGRLPSAGEGPYSATKAGVNAFAEALRQEGTARGVRVVLVEPGSVETELVGDSAASRVHERAADPTHGSAAVGLPGRWIAGRSATTAL
jgi:NADP-dependent 3-hydroxy acid dehydrogenase YdfG